MSISKGSIEFLISSSNWSRFYGQIQLRWMDAENLFALFLFN